MCSLFFQLRVLCLLRGLVLLDQITVLYQSRFPVCLVLLKLSLGLCRLNGWELLTTSRANISGKGLCLNAAPYRPVFLQLFFGLEDVLLTVIHHLVQVVKRPREFSQLTLNSRAFIFYRHSLACPVRGILSVQCCKLRLIMLDIGLGSGQQRAAIQSGQIGQDLTLLQFQIGLVHLCLVIVQYIQLAGAALALVNADGKAVQRLVCAFALGHQYGLVLVHRPAPQRCGQLGKLRRTGENRFVIRQPAHLGQLLASFLPRQIPGESVHIGQQLEHALVDDGSDHALVLTFLARYIVDGVLGRVAVVLSDRTAAGLRPLLT